jgi:hypothetical protein
MSSIALSPNSSGSALFTIAAPGTNDNRTLTLPDATTTLVGTDATQTLTNKTIQGGAITLDTAKASTSGTVVDFTGIPSWAKRITVMLQGVSLNGTSRMQMQIGDAGGIETSGYTGAVGLNGTGAVSATAAFALVADGTPSASNSYSGLLTLCNFSGNTWVLGGTLARVGDAGAYMMGGAKTLSQALDRVRITTVNGTDTFDAGSINIMYEG